MYRRYFYLLVFTSPLCDRSRLQSVRRGLVLDLEKLGLHDLGEDYYFQVLLAGKGRLFLLLPTFDRLALLVDAFGERRELLGQELFPSLKVVLGIGHGEVDKVACANVDHDRLYVGQLAGNVQLFAQKRG